MSSRHTQIFGQFGRGQIMPTEKTGINCVIYTRVSTKEQAENNLSLDTQLKYCLAFAMGRGFNVLGQFGGTYESAKNDERKEFNRMQAFVKKSRKSISFIIVYSLDRFSRSGANAIYITNELKKQGITLLSVTQPSDANTSSGILQQNIQFIFSQYDNDIRREKCMAGTREKLLRGFWCGPVPMGYDRYKKGKEQYIKINETGRLIRKAFEWKVAFDLPSTDIVNRLKAMGLKIHKQMLSKIFRNPFYCGMLAHKALDGQVVEGKHEKLVSKDLFLRANQIVMSRKHKGRHGAKDPKISLRRFVSCDRCGTPFVGYETKKKKLHYYKCSKIGCASNRSAKALNQEFIDLLKPLGISEALRPIIKDLATEAIRDASTASFWDGQLMERKLHQVKRKIELMREKYLLGEMEKEAHDRFIQKYEAEQAQINKELDEITMNLSTHYKTVNKVVEISYSLITIWCRSGFRGKEDLQYLVFPDGLRYNTREKTFRMARVNPMFTPIGYV